MFSATCLPSAGRSSARRACVRGAYFLCALALSVAAFGSAGSKAAVGQTAPPAAGTWSETGPRVGVVNALVVAPSNPAVLYAGIVTSSGNYVSSPDRRGVYKSVDGGLSWGRTGLSRRSVLALAVDPGNPDIVYAGTSNGGLFKSTDGGTTWAGPYLSNRDIYALAVDPVTPSVLYASSPNYGTYKSTDGGINWGGGGNGGGFLTVSPLAIDPTNPGTIYAAAGSGTFGGLRKTTDGGANWTLLRAGLPTTGEFISVALAPNSPATLYLGTAASGVYLSTDGGLNWTARNNGLPAVPITVLAVSPNNSSLLLAGTTRNGVYRSADGGATWNKVALSALGGAAIVFDPVNPSTVHLGTTGSGVYKSGDGGGTWAQSAGALPLADVIKLVLDPTNQAVLYAGTADGVYKSTDRGQSWHPTGLIKTYTSGGSPVTALVIDPLNPLTLYAGLDFNGVWKTTDGGLNWTQVYLTNNTHVEALAIDAASPSNVYLALYPVRLFKSNNGGAQWSQAVAPGDVYTLMTDNRNGTLYAGTDFSLFKSTNGAASWSVTGLRNPVRSNPYVLAVAFDPISPTTLYAGTYNDGAYKSTDGGATWGHVFSDVTTSVWSVAVSPAQPDIVLAGTDTGVYLSTDGGATAVALNDGLPAAVGPVNALVFDAPGNNLYAGTGGAGLFVRHLANCSNTITPTSQAFTPAGGADTVNVTAAGDCAWVAVSNAPWLTVTGGASGAGNGTVNYSVAANTTGPARTGTMTIAGQTFTVTQAAAPTTVQFSQAAYTFGEAATSAQLIVTRTGDTAGTTRVNYMTVDNPAAVRCDNTTTLPGVAFARCDYATSLDTLTFNPGDTQKTIAIPLIDDGHVEPAESFQVALSNPGGAAFGTPTTTTVTITDNDAAGAANPVFTSPFFVRQQYLDFLSREPDAAGFNAYLNLLNNCPDVNNVDPNSPSAACDRITVSAAFFGSQEFQLKGFFVFRFYRAAFNRLPAYTEVVADMRGVTGRTPSEVFQKKAAFANSFTQRQEFVSAYGALTNEQYVAALTGRYGLTQIRTPDPQQPDGTSKVTLTSADLTNGLNANTLTRAQVLRALADSDQVFNAEFNKAFVGMQYYGYLRRTPDAPGFNAWLNYLTAHPDDFRTMVNGFMNSTEYRLRFGPVQ